MSAPLTTPRTRRWLKRASVAAAALVAGATFAPTAAQASTPSPVGTVTWNLRTSWVNYLTNPAWALGFDQGRVDASDGAAPNAGSLYTTYNASLWDNYAYSYDFPVASDSGSPRTVALNGTLDFVMAAHSIDIELTDLQIVDNPSGPEELLVDGHYDPLTSSPVALNDAHAFDIAETATSGVYTVTLTSVGAQIFNGGSNGSYSAGQEFGSVAFS